MRALVIGYGLQGRKRHQVAKDDVVGIVDPIAVEANYKTLAEVPLSAFDIAFLCVPDGEKMPLLTYLLENQKPTLVEKPLLCFESKIQEKLVTLSKKTICYTAYNHRFEPHIKRIKTVLADKTLGTIYAMHLFYGNGTAANVQASPWRDQGRGVVQDLGSHLLDITCYWDSAFAQRQFCTVVKNCFENKAPDHAILHSIGKPYAHLTMTLLSWKNTFVADIWGEKGSIHMNGLCKWGPSYLSIRHREYPSGKPREENITLTDPDNTWTEEYRHFLSLIETGTSTIENDVWIERQL
jgi:scyllo-inositol 2-dehydrogenase (NADP+)